MLPDGTPIVCMIMGLDLYYLCTGPAQPLTTAGEELLIDDLYDMYDLSELWDIDDLYDLS